ncbi:MAG: hypothetical protein OQK57_09460, partial [Ignavibacteriaceae bacterium]|nr:hypothetical protein [Ignavibacteriaceae bacterium]
MMTKIVSIALLLVLSSITSSNIAQDNKNLADTSATNKVFYAIEINDVVCGYSEASETPVKKEEKDLIEQELHIFIMLSLFGSEFNTEMNIKAIIDPESRKASYIFTNIKQGATDMDIELTVSGSRVTIKSPLKAELAEIDITPETVIGSDEIATRLKKDFYSEGKTEATYNILELIESEVQTSEFKKTGEETISLAGKSFNTIIIEQTNTKTGLKTTYWLSPDYDYFVKFKVQNRTVYLSDQSVVDKIKVANMDEDIVTKTNVAISDVQSLSYMKVDVVIEPIGHNFNEDDLNVQG